MTLITMLNENRAYSCLEEFKLLGGGWLLTVGQDSDPVAAPARIRVLSYSGITCLYSERFQDGKADSSIE